MATHPEVEDSVLDCVVDGHTVKIGWDLQFFAPIRGWILARDGDEIVKLPASAQGYVDHDVPSGEHVYTLFVINMPFDGVESVDVVVADGVDQSTSARSISRVGQCTVIVGDFGISCAVEGRTVYLKWPLLRIEEDLRVDVSHFVIRRNGVPVGRVPGDVAEFSDVVSAPGVYRYTVHGEYVHGHAFLIGACTVRVSNVDGFLCRVDPPDVVMDWSHVPLPEVVIDFFVVIRDHTVVGVTRGASFTDSPPGPGEYSYRVVAIWGTLGADDALRHDNDEAVRSLSFVVGQCEVVMPGRKVPPPEELTCVNLDAPEDLRDRLAELDVFVRASDVLLVWQKPVEYDRVIIARNDDVIARIDGGELYYLDRDVSPGDYVYSVTGVVGDDASPPAKCGISLPAPPLPPPTNLRCVFVELRVEDHVDADPNGISTGAVLLSWRNGAGYDFLVIVRNGARVARVDGDATSYRDLFPPAGLNQYEIFGVRGVRRSESDWCSVEVPPLRVPKPRNLRCVVIHPVPDPVITDLQPIAEVADVAEVPEGDELTFAPAGVFLRWTSPIPYGRVLIRRNGTLLATLPGDSESYHDPVRSFGVFRYEVIGVVRDVSSGSAVCEVEIEPSVTPPVRDLECAVDILDIVPPDPFLEADAATGDAVVGIDNQVFFPRVVVRLTWVNPVHYSAILVYRDGDLLAELPGDSMFYPDFNPPGGPHTYGLQGLGLNGVSSRSMYCDIDVPPNVVPPVENLRCVGIQAATGGGSAIISWSNAARYDSIVIARNGDQIAVIPGDSVVFRDPSLEPGIYEYVVVAINGDRVSRGRECTVAIHGPPPRNILYFSSGVFTAEDVVGANIEDADLDANVTPLVGKGHLLSIASNTQPIQGWSFGICSDPSLLVVEDATIDGTDTGAVNGGEGPDFLVIRAFERGIAMAAVIDDQDTTNTLPPDTDHRLLQVKYAAGADAESGVAYPVNYCDTLGSPPVAVLYVVKGFALEPETRPGFVVLPSPIEPGFLRADVNDDEKVDMTDAVWILKYLFRDGEKPACLDAADTNASGRIDIADGVYVLQYKFVGGAPPPAPYPNCGPTPFVLGCEEPRCP